MSDSYQRLHRAVTSPGTGVAALLRELSVTGIDINSTDQSGFSCLMVAVKNGKTERALVLIDHGASLTQANTAGWTAFHFAASCGDLSAMTAMAAQAGCEDIDMFMDDLLGRLTRGGKLPKDLATGVCRSWLEKAEACADADALRRYIGVSGESDQRISNAAAPAQGTNTAQPPEMLCNGSTQREPSPSGAIRRPVPFLVVVGLIGLAFAAGIAVSSTATAPSDAPLPRRGLSLLPLQRRNEPPNATTKAAGSRGTTRWPRWLREMAMRVRSAMRRRMHSSTGSGKELKP